MESTVIIDYLYTSSLQSVSRVLSEASNGVLGDIEKYNNIIKYKNKLEILSELSERFVK